MVNFLIQTVKGKVVHDFALALTQAHEFAKWKDSSAGVVTYGGFQRLQDDDALAHCIPVGGVSFVQEFLNKHHNGLQMKPIYIPDSLKDLKYLKRLFKEGTKDTVAKNDSPVFVKQIDRVKGFAEVISSDTDLPDGQLFITEALDVVSEWRIFVYEGEVIGAKNYAGDFFRLPDTDFIYDVVKQYQEAPPVYTLDVMVDTRGETSVIEVHDFVSCGLYGFTDHRLPVMFVRGFNSMLNRSAN